MIVLDTNSFPSVFDSKSIDHADFCYVLRWVLDQKQACFVYGGTKYKLELSKMTTYLKIMNQLKRAGKFVEINGKMIDDNAKRLKGICTDAAFDDEHIVAILNISGCRLVCTKDQKSVPYIKRKDFYSDKKLPKIYSSAKNRNLLNRKNMVELKNQY